MLGLCDNYDVAWGDDGEPFIFYDALWWPICSMFFNDNTARLFCQQLDYHDGTFEVIETGHDYDLDIVSKNEMVPMKSFLVGNCTETDSSLFTCTGGCNRRMWEIDGTCGEESCDAGKSVRIKVHCTLPPTTTTTVTVETTSKTSNGTANGTANRMLVVDVEERPNINKTEDSTEILTTDDQFENEKSINATANTDVDNTTNINERVNSAETGATDPPITDDIINTEISAFTEMSITSEGHTDVYNDEEGTTDMNKHITLDESYGVTIDFYPDENDTTNANDIADTNETPYGNPHARIGGILDGLDLREMIAAEPSVKGEGRTNLMKKSSCKGTYCSTKVMFYEFNFKNDKSIAKMYMICIYSLSQNVLLA